MVENPGEADMRILVKDGQELTRYESTGETGEGGGVRAGVTYRLADGRMVYVPEAPASEGGRPPAAAADGGGNTADE